MHPIIRTLIPVVKMLARTLGRDCEVVLHELSHPKTSIVHIENGHVTGRRVGDGVRDLFNTVLASPFFAEDMLVNYLTLLPDGRMLRSSTVLIRDEEGKLIGAVCINLDLSRLAVARQILDELTAAIDPTGSSAKESGEAQAGVVAALDSLIGGAMVETGAGAGNAGGKVERMKVVRFLEEKGAFRIRGAVDVVARRLGVSRYTIYNYLREIRAQNGGGAQVARMLEDMR